MITLTVTKANGIAQDSLSRGFHGIHIMNLRPSTEGNLSSTAIFEALNTSGQWITTEVSETYSAVLASITTDMAESGAEVTTNKATGFGTINDTLYPSVEAVVENFQPDWYINTPAPQNGTYSATLTPAPTAYYAGMRVFLNVTTTNTGAATLNLNSLGAKDIQKGTAGTTALSASDLIAGKVYTLIYDGTRFQINL